MEEMLWHHAEEREEGREQQRALDILYDRIRSGEDAEEALWETVIAFQDHPFCTSSGLPFQYKVRRKRSGEYSGEMIVSRKEDSKTLTRSSVLLAFRRVLEGMERLESTDGSVEIVPAEFKGPKAIGQIFGVSYIYSLFWRFGLIKVPEKVGDRMKFR